MLSLWLGIGGSTSGAGIGADGAGSEEGKVSALAGADGVGIGDGLRGGSGGSGATSGTGAGPVWGSGAIWA